ncbi:MAG: restriction endonuclease subunit S [Clostridiaceae bacterium]
MEHEFEMYEGYKDSGIEWIGAIPEHWGIKRLKEISKINNLTLSENTSESYEFDYIDIGNVTYGVKECITEHMIFKNSPSRARRIVKKGDTIISTVRTYLKAITSIDEDISNLIVSTGFAVISPSNDIFRKFISYLLASDIIVNEICALSKGVSYPAINSSIIGDLLCTIPSLQEQQAIADYLDIKTAQIDHKIELLTKKSAKYSEIKKSLINEIVTRGLDKTVAMKDSGIEWIGEIPEHWEVKRFKDLGFLYSGLSGKSKDDFKDGNKYSRNYITFVNIANNQNISPNYMKKVIIYPYEKQNKIKQNDLFILMSSENYEDIGKSALLKIDLIDTYLNSFCKGIRFTKSYISPNFINYLLISKTYRNSISIEGKGFTRINLKIEKINNLVIVIPPLQEQQAIANYLDTKTTQMDHIIATINTEIEKLKELRKTLINDVVTGKIKVTGEEE